MVRVRRGRHRHRSSAFLYDDDGEATISLCLSTNFSIFERGGTITIGPVLLLCVLIAEKKGKRKTKAKEM